MTLQIGFTRRAYRPLMPLRDPGRCPDCGERVTPYAAGCALCGADLDPRRWQPRPSPVRKLLAGVRRSLA
jgi:predicted amidophosphoribosyltransferase